MDKQWTLHVENFGKIVEAEVTISPLMCFVGDLWMILDFKNKGR